MQYLEYDGEGEDPAHRPDGDHPALLPIPTDNACTVETSVADPDPTPDLDPPDPHALCLLYTAHRPDGDHPALLPIPTDSAHC